MPKELDVGVLKIHRSRTTAKAAVARASSMPDSRAAGRATSTPTTPAITAPASRAHGLPPWPRCAIAMAPMAAKLIWHRHICPAHPTSGTSERAMRPSPTLLAARRASAS